MNKKALEIFNYVFFSLVIVLCLILTIIYNLSWLTFVVCATSIVYIVYLSDRNLLNFLVGFVSSTTYIIVSYRAHLYGEAIFYLCFDIPMILVSFLMWQKHMETKLKVETRKLSAKKIIIIILVSAAVVVGYGFVLRAIGGTNSFVDALSSVVTLVATLLMATRYREQWIMWIVVYIVSIVLWATTFDLLMLIMSISCLISSVIGYINWTISAKEEPKQTLQAE